MSTPSCYGRVTDLVDGEREGRMPQATGRADAIVAGVLRDGERLPSESELAKRLGVAVVTAREALVALRDKGLVLTRRGRDGGSFVTHDRDAAARMLDGRVRALSRI